MAFRQADIDNALEKEVKGSGIPQPALRARICRESPLISLEDTHTHRPVGGVGFSTPPTASRRVRGLGRSPRRLKCALLSPIFRRICIPSNSNITQAKETLEDLLQHGFHRHDPAFVLERRNRSRASRNRTAVWSVRCKLKGAPLE